MIIKFKLKVLKSASGLVFKIEKILLENDNNTKEDITRYTINNREYSVGQEIKEEKLYRLKLPGIQLFYV